MHAQMSMRTGFVRISMPIIMKMPNTNDPTNMVFLPNTSGFFLRQRKRASMPSACSI